MAEKEHKVPALGKREVNLPLRMAAAVLAPIFRLMFKIVPQGIDNLPKTGSYILVSNHTTYVDPLAMAYFVYIKLRRAPHFLAKESLFRLPIVGSWLPHLGQIPIYRAGRSNEDSLRTAKAYLRAGHTIIMFPEGTLTRDPNLWPMRGRSGAIRLALESGVAVYPVAHLGAEKVLETYSSKLKPSPFKQVQVRVGEQIDLSKYSGDSSTEQMNAATEVVMNSITKLLSEMRGEKAPEKRYDPKQMGQSVHGNFRKKSK